MFPVVRHGDDDQFADIVRWTRCAMIAAEEHGITSSNLDEMLKSVTPGIAKAFVGKPRRKL